MDNTKTTTPLKRVYSAGIIGCGWIGCGVTHFPNIVLKEDTHTKAYKDNPRTKLKWFSDKTPERAETMGRYYHVDWTDGGIPPADIVSVCTPVETHCQIVCDLASSLPSVKAIYCEKPIACTLDEADKMVDICHKYGVILQINHQRRFINPKFTFARDLIDTGTHAFDRMRQLFGEPLEITDHDIKFRNITVDLEYIKSNEHIFELDCVRSKERMIYWGVQHLVECLDRGKESISSGEEARETLKWVLKFKELNENL